MYALINAHRAEYGVEPARCCRSLGRAITAIASRRTTRPPARSGPAGCVPAGGQSEGIREAPRGVRRAEDPEPAVARRRHGGAVYRRAAHAKQRAPRCSARAAPGHYAPRNGGALPAGSRAAAVHGGAPEPTLGGGLHVRRDMSRGIGSTRRRIVRSG